MWREPGVFILVQAPSVISNRVLLGVSWQSATPLGGYSLILCFAQGLCVFVSPVEDVLLAAGVVIRWALFN